MKRILVIRYKKSIGDTIIGTTLCESIKKKYPNSQVDYLVYENLTELFYSHRTIDNVLTLNRKSGVKEYLKLLKKIRKNKYDIVIDCRTLFLTAMFSFFQEQDRGSENIISIYNIFIRTVYVVLKEKKIK